MRRRMPLKRTHQRRTRAGPASPPARQSGSSGSRPRRDEQRDRSWPPPRQSVAATHAQSSTLDVRRACESRAAAASGQRRCLEHARGVEAGPEHAACAARTSQAASQSLIQPCGARRARASWRSRNAARHEWPSQPGQHRSRDQDEQQFRRHERVRACWRPPRHASLTATCAARSACTLLVSASCARSARRSNSPGW